MPTSEIISSKIDTTISDEPETEFSPTKEVRISKPSSFNGDQRRVKEFIQECNVYLRTYTRLTNWKWHLYCHLWMRRKHANGRRILLNKITRPDMKLDFPKFKDFLILIQHTFKPADQAGEAMNKLELLWQGNTSWTPGEPSEVSLGMSMTTSA